MKTYAIYTADGMVSAYHTPASAAAELRRLRASGIVCWARRFRDGV